MTKQERQGLEIMDSFLDLAKRVAMLSGISATLFSVGWTLWAEPKIDKKIEPVKHDVMYIKLIQEEIIDPMILEKVKKKMERLKL